MTHQKGIRSLPYGYNAALLSHLTGDQSLVTTIDLDEALVLAARPLLESTSMHVGEGRLGVPERAPFERIIATAASPRLPQAWCDQLATGGRIVVELSRNLVGALAVIHQEEAGNLEGLFLSTRSAFMPLRSIEENPRQMQRAEQNPHLQTISEKECSPDLLKNRALRFFLQWLFPPMEITWSGKDHDHLFPTVHLGQSRLVFRPTDIPGAWSVEEYGSAFLHELLAALQQWRDLGSPEITAYRFHMDATSQQQWLTIHDDYPLLL